jgi:hypothetical protein
MKQINKIWHLKNYEILINKFENPDHKLTFHQVKKSEDNTQTYEALLEKARKDLKNKKDLKVKNRL